MTAKNSMAVWCETGQARDDTCAEFHFNLWRFAESSEGILSKIKNALDKNGVRDDLLEVGIMIDDPHKINCIKIFFPFDLQAEDISDCGPSFARDNIANAIFNEQLDKTVKDGGKCVALSKNKHPFCDVHQFTINEGVIDKDEIDIDNNVEGGSIVTITETALLSLRTHQTDVVRGYFRLRVKLHSGSSNPYINSIEPRDKGWNSSIDHIDYIDFRLNEARTLPVKVAQKMKAKSKNLAKVKLVAFLTAVPVVSAISSSHEAWRKSRLLEHEVWKDYVDAGVPEGMVVYHWKAEVTKSEPHKGIKKQYVEDFSAFVKLQTRKSGGKILVTYVTIAFLFGVLGSLTAGWIDPIISSFVATKWESFGASDEVAVPKEIGTNVNEQTSEETNEANE